MAPSTKESTITVKWKVMANTSGATVLLIKELGKIIISMVMVNTAGVMVENTSANGTTT